MTLIKFHIEINIFGQNRVVKLKCISEKIWLTLLKEQMAVLVLENDIVV